MCSQAHRDRSRRPLLLSMAARCAAAASCAALATWVPRARCDRATPPRPAADDGDDDALARGRSRRPYRALVVGAGLSGALAAKELRRRFSEEDSEERDDGSECNGGEKRGLHLSHPSLISEKLVINIVRSGRLFEIP